MQSYKELNPAIIQGPQENGTIRNYSIVIISMPKYYIISTDKDPNLRIESFPMINLRGVSTKRNLSHEILISLLKNVFLCFALIYTHITI